MPFTVNPEELKFSAEFRIKEIGNGMTRAKAQRPPRWRAEARHPERMRGI